MNSDELGKSHGLTKPFDFPSAKRFTLVNSHAATPHYLLLQKLVRWDASLCVEEIKAEGFCLVGISSAVPFLVFA